MDISLSRQVFAFFAMAFCGASCGVIFDLFRAVRRLHKSASGVVAIQDIIFWLLELTVVYMAAFKLNYAHIRAYEGIALIVGSWIYFMTASPYVIRALCTFMGAVFKALCFVSKPFFRLGAILVNTLKKIGESAACKLKNLICKIKHRQKSKNIFTI